MLSHPRPYLIKPLLAIFTLTLLGLISACDSSDNKGPTGRPTPPPPPVTALTIKPENVTIYRDYAGRIRGAREIEVRARVGGILTERLYKEGQAVNEGQPLFRIDPRPFEITLSQRSAELATARATLNQTEREWRRVSRLFDQKVASERDRDQSLSQYELAQAQYQAAEARVAEARLNLEYAIVKAPINGIVGLETLSEGSLINSGALLTTLIQQDPVQVLFSLPEQDALLYRQSMLDSIPAEDKTFTSVSLYFASGQQYPLEGRVNFTDSVIDTRTGTISVRAVFPNSERRLVPGQFVRIRLTLARLNDALRLPATAIGEGRTSPQVFVLLPDQTVATRSVTLGPLLDGQQIILDGLNAGDQVIINGNSALRNGMTVRPVDTAGE